MLPPTSVFCFVAEDSFFFTCLRSEADWRDFPGLLLVGLGSLLFSGDDLSESDALPLPDPDLDDPEELESNSLENLNVQTLRKSCPEFHSHVPQFHNDLWSSIRIEPSDDSRQVMSP
jgi:hypothetical protein